MKNIFKILKNNIIILVCAPIIGLLLMILVHLLPTEPMRQHVLESMDMIEQEFTDELVVDGYHATLTGNFTDCLMLEHAIYNNEEHSALEQVMHMYRAETYNVEGDPTGWWPGYSLKDYVEFVPQPREVEYGRYWHGYLVVLKPILLLTSFNTFRLLNSALQILGVGWIIMGLTRKKAEPLAKAFLVSLPFLFFISTFASLSLSICFYLLILALLAQIKWDQHLYDKKLYYIYFLIIGIATSYFDFLTYPLVTLAFPLVVYLFFHSRTVENDFKRIFSFSLEWGIGYVGMWASKWLLSDLLTDSSTIKDALATIGTRTQSATGGYGLNGYLSVLKHNFSPFTNWCYFFIIIFILLGAAILIIKNGIKNSIKNLYRALPYIFIAMFPFLWYLATQNHSIQHWQYTCRILSVTVFALIPAIYRIATPSSK